MASTEHMGIPERGQTPLHVKAGFTLAELLTVIFIIGFMSLLTISALPDGQAASTQKASSQASSFFSLARSVAVSKGTEVRILVNVGGGAASTDADVPVQNYRRLVMQVDESTTPTPDWVFYEDLYLPEGVFFRDSLVGGSVGTESGISESIPLYLGYAVEPSSPSYTWGVYQWNANGTCSDPGVHRFIVGSGFIDSSGELVVPPALQDQVDGFALLTSGTVMHFQGPDHINSASGGGG